MDVLLAVGITLCAICIIILQARNHSLYHTIGVWKEAHVRALEEARGWESKYWKEYSNATDLADALDSAENGESLTPTQGYNQWAEGILHSTPDQIMAGSDDPVWDTVIDCRASGVMAEWLNRHPEFKGMQPHRIYGEFATYILGLPEDQRYVNGVAMAVRRG